MENYNVEYDLALAIYEKAEKALIKKLEEVNNIKKAIDESNLDFERRLNNLIEPYEKTLREVRDIFHNSIAKYIIVKHSLAPEMITLLHEAINHWWMKYIQFHLLLNGTYLPDTKSHWQDLIKEARGFNEIKRLVEFDTRLLEKRDFPITINYNGKQLAAIESERLWIRIFELFEDHILKDAERSLNSRLFLTANNRQRFPEQIGIDEIATEIFIFLKTKCGITKKENRVLIIVSLFNLLRVPVYIGHKPQYHSFEKGHIYNYLKRK